MKKVLLPFLVVAVFGMYLSYVQEATGASQPPTPEGEIKMDFATNPAKNVMFDHKDHKAYACAECHHPVKRDGGQSSYKKCSTSGCHDIKGRSQDPMSYYQAMHNKKPDAGYSTCISCHTKIAGTDKAKKQLLISCIGSGCHPKK